MKMFLTLLCLSLVPIVKADTGDKLITGDLVVNGSIRVDTLISGDGLLLRIDSTKIAALAVDSEKIVKSAVNTEKLGSESVNTGKLYFTNRANVDSGKIVCIMSGNLGKLGTCGPTTVGATALCDCQ